MTKFIDQYTAEYSLLKKRAKQFSQSHPRIASHIQSSEKKSRDPFVNELIESFAFIASDLKQSINQQQTRLGESLLNSLYPHLSKPFPACSIMAFNPKPSISTQHTIARGTELAIEFNDINCKALTAYPVLVQPITITDITFEDVAHHTNNTNQSTLKIALKFNENTNVEQYQLQPIDFFINADYLQAIQLYQLIGHELNNIEILDEKDTQIDMLGVEHIRLLGFNDNESLLAIEDKPATGYELLTEYIHFPQKFLFFKLNLNGVASHNLGQHWRIQFNFKANPTGLNHQIDNSSLLLHCSPIINIFKKMAEPLQWDQAQTEYPVIADNYTHPQNIAVHSINTIVLQKPDHQTQVVSPFFSVQHNLNPDAIYWQTQRVDSQDYGYQNTVGHELLLSLVSTQGTPYQHLDSGLLNIELFCTNRDCLADIAINESEPWYFWDSDDANYVVPSQIQPFTSSRYPDINETSLWKILSHICCEKKDYAQANSTQSLLETFFALYQVQPSFDCQTLMNSIDYITVTNQHQRHPNDPMGGFVQGTQLTIHTEANQYDSESWFLLGNILFTLFSENTAINSFVSFNIVLPSYHKTLHWTAQMGKKPPL